MFVAFHSEEVPPLCVLLLKHLIEIRCFSAIILNFTALTSQNSCCATSPLLQSEEYLSVVEHVNFIIYINS